MNTDLEQQLREALAPCEPGPAPLEAVMARLSALPAPNRGKRRGSRRVVIIGSLVALAAAAMLATYMARPPVEPTSVVQGIIDSNVAAVPTTSSDAADVAGPAAKRVATPVIAPAVIAEPATVAAKAETAITPVTVLIQPLQLATEDPAIQALAREYYAALLAEVRRIPGVVVITELPKPEGGAAPDWRLSATGRNAPSTLPNQYVGGQWLAKLAIESLKPAVGGVPSISMTSIESIGALGPASCPEDRCTPAGIAATQVTSLRAMLPHNPALDAQLQTRALDASKTQAERRQALFEVLVRNQKDGKPLDADIIRGAIELVSSATVPAERGLVWRNLRGQKDPSLLAPLVRAVREEPDDTTRLAALVDLTLGFGADGTARTALEAVAAADRKPMLRKVAERAISGDAPWRAFVVDGMKDANLTSAQQLEPLMWMLDVKQADPRMRETLDAVGRDLLDKARPGLLAALSTPATADNGLGGLRNMAVLELFGSMNHPGASGLLIECFDRQPSEMALAMLSQRRGDADVRRKLEQVATDFPQENLRKLAGMLLAVPSP